MSEFEKVKPNSWKSKGNTILVSYFKTANSRNIEKDYHFIGFHEGEITGNNIQIEDHTDVDVLLDSVEAKELKITEKIADEIIERADKNGKVKLTKEQKDRIKDYAKDN